MKQKILFVCTSNLTRSPTCEDIFKDLPDYEAKSAGTADHAVVRLSQMLVDWADTIVVMSERTDHHLTYLREHFHLEGKQIFDLDLPDFIYDTRGESLLVADLTDRLRKYFPI